MCIGTMCTHHIDPAVQEAEKDYDNLDDLRRVYQDMHEGDPAGLLFYLPLWVSHIGVGHLQPMFTVKYDHVPGGPSTDSASWPEPHGNCLEACDE